MKEVILTKGMVALVDDADFEIVSKFKWHASRQGSQKKPYACRFDYSSGKKVKVWMHRYIMNPEPWLVVDHISGDGLDNRRENLEVVTFEENYIRSQRKRVDRDDICL